MTKKDPHRAAALRNLRRLAGGKINDAAILAIRGGELSNEEIARLDLSAVTEIKSPKAGGGCDVKLADPLEAIGLMLEHCEPENAGAGDSFFEALNRAAEADEV